MPDPKQKPRSPSPAGDEEAEPRMLACEKCDALFIYPEVAEGESAICYHCGFPIFTRRPNALQRSAAWALSAASLFVVANFFPFITVDVGGQRNGIVLAESVQALADRENIGLATAVALFIFAAPALLIAGMLYVLCPLLAGRNFLGTNMVARWIYGFSLWDMTEVFLLGVLVSLLKLLEIASVTLGISFYAFAVMIVCITASMSCIGRHELWELVEEATP